MTDKITIERETVQELIESMRRLGWDDQITRSLRAALAAQPAEAVAWADKAMELATDFGVESLRVGSSERQDGFDRGVASWKTVALREKREAARERLRQHLYAAPPAPAEPTAGVYIRGHALRDISFPQPADAQPEPADLIQPESLFVCGQMGAHVTRVRVEPPAPADAKQAPVAYLTYCHSLDEYDVVGPFSGVANGWTPPFPVYAAPPHLIERIDHLAESGLCQLTAGGKHAFLKDIRAMIAAGDKT